MTIATTSGKHGCEQTRSSRVSFASTDKAMRVARIVATITTMAVITTTAITTASEVHKAPTNAMDVMDATDVEVATISQTANATQVAENEADAAMAMTARQMRPIRRNAVANERRQSHIGGSTMCKKRNTNVIESNDNVDDEDVDNNALPAMVTSVQWGTML